MGTLSARRLIVLVAIVCLIAVSCGGNEERADNSGAGSAESTTTAATSTTEASTTTAATTTAAPTTTVASTTSESTSAPADVESHLADGLLTTDDLPDYMVVNFENGLALGDESGLLGDLPVNPCGDDVTEAAATNARQSVFEFDLTVELDPQPVLIAVIPVVRQPTAVGGSGLVSQFADALSRCVGQEISHPSQGDPVFVFPMVEIEERSGVQAVGSQMLTLDSGLTLFDFAFEAESLDGWLYVGTFGATTPEEAQALALPVVEAFQDRISACAADTTLCSATL